MTFKVGITGDFAPGGHMAGCIERPLGELLATVPGLEWSFLHDTSKIPPGLGGDFDAVITGEPAWTAESFSDADRLVLVAFWGIGVDRIDLSAATAADVAVANSPAAGNQRSVAESVLTFMLSLSKRLLEKDRLTKRGLGLQAQEIRGTLLHDRVIGTVGFGATARALARLVESFSPARVLAFDPYVEAAVAEQHRVELVGLETVFRESDFVAVMCSLNKETRGLVDAGLLRQMKPSAYLVNAARGGIVVQSDLVRALKEGWIAGAALDVTEPEPPSADDPIVGFENVIVTGHAIAWTEESLAGACEEPCRTVRRLYEERELVHVVNQAVLERPGFREKLQRLAAFR